jgi:hypothetical protein
VKGKTKRKKTHSNEFDDTGTTTLSSFHREPRLKFIGSGSHTVFPFGNLVFHREVGFRITDRSFAPVIGSTGAAK